MMNAAQLGQLVEDHASALALYARQWTRAPEDIVQEAFLKLVAEVKTPPNVAAWLFRVVRNLAISELRGAQRRRKRELLKAEENSAWFKPAGSHELDVDRATQALQSLPDEEREAITLHLWGGLTFVEMATVLESSASTVNRWYLAGLERLRERLNVSCPNIMIKKN